MPDGFWFVSVVVVGLIAASEWARRLAVRGMRSPPRPLRDEVGERRARSRAPQAGGRRGTRVAVLRPLLPRNEVVAIPQWQKDP